MYTVHRHDEDHPDAFIYCLDRHIARALAQRLANDCNCTFVAKDEDWDYHCEFGPDKERVAELERAASLGRRRVLAERGNQLEESRKRLRSVRASLRDALVNGAPSLDAAIATIEDIIASPFLDYKDWESVGIIPWQAESEEDSDA